MLLKIMMCFPERKFLLYIIFKQQNKKKRAEDFFLNQPNLLIRLTTQLTVALMIYLNQ